MVRRIRFLLLLVSFVVMGLPVAASAQPAATPVVEPEPTSTPPATPPMQTFASQPTAIRVRANNCGTTQPTGRVEFTLAGGTFVLPPPPDDAILCSPASGSVFTLQSSSDNGVTWVDNETVTVTAWGTAQFSKLQGTLFRIVEVSPTGATSDPFSTDTVNGSTSIVVRVDNLTPMTANPLGTITVYKRYCTASYAGESGSTWVDVTGQQSSAADARCKMATAANAVTVQLMDAATNQVIASQTIGDQGTAAFTDVGAGPYYIFEPSTGLRTREFSGYEGTGPVTVGMDNALPYQYKHQLRVHKAFCPATTPQDPMFAEDSWWAPIRNDCTSGTSGSASIELVRVDGTTETTVSTVPVDINGYAVWNDLTPGTYVMREVETSAQSAPITIQETTDVLSWNLTNTFVVPQTGDGTLYIQHVFCPGQTGTTTFSVPAPAGEAPPPDPSCYDAASPSAVWTLRRIDTSTIYGPQSNQVFGGLPQGTYELVDEITGQTSAPFTLPGTGWYTVVVSDPAPTTTNLTIQAFDCDYPKPGGVPELFQFTQASNVIFTMAASTSTPACVPVEGSTARFVLTNVTTGQVIGTYTVDENGRVTIPDVPRGIYTLTDQQTSQTSTPFTIGNGDASFMDVFRYLQPPSTPPSATPPPVATPSPITTPTAPGLSPTPSVTPTSSVAGTTVRQTPTSVGVAGNSHASDGPGGTHAAVSTDGTKTIESTVGQTPSSGSTGATSAKVTRLPATGSGTEGGTIVGALGTAAAIACAAAGWHRRQR